MQTAVQECLDSGFDGVLTKPIDFDHLITTLVEIAGAEVSIESPIHSRAGDQDSIDSQQQPEREPIRFTLQTEKERFRQIVAQFADRLDERFRSIESAVNSQHFEQLMEQGHTLKGAAGNCGFSPVAEN